MPVIIAIGILWIIYKATKKPARKRTVAYFSVREKARRKQERTEDKQLMEQALMLRQAAKAEKEAAQKEKEEQEKAQALEDIKFYHAQIKRYREILNDAEKQLNQARKELTENEEIEAVAPGAVSVKVLEKQRRERDKLTRKVITLENQIHARETKLGKAYYKANI